MKKWFASAAVIVNQIAINISMTLPNHLTDTMVKMMLRAVF
jgi:hypothetical protein